MGLDHVQYDDMIYYDFGSLILGDQVFNQLALTSSGRTVAQLLPNLTAYLHD